jgi:tetratricopeptide (TPR) repeat protein
MVAVLVLALALSGAPTDARAEFEAGRKHFLAGEYADARPHLEQAYVLSNKRPSTIHALAQCERALGHLDRAIALFRDYVATSPTPADAPAVEKTIALLEARLKVETAAPAPEETAPDLFQDNARRQKQANLDLGWGQDAAVTPPAAEEPFTSTPTFWLILGTGMAAVAAMGIGLAFALRSSNTEPYGGSLNHILTR